MIALAKNRIAPLLFPQSLRCADVLLINSLVLLLVVGLIMLTSASMEYAAAKHGNPWFLLQRQSMYMIAGGATFLAGLAVPVSLWQQHSSHLLLVAFLLLVAVLLPGVGLEVNGSQRWIPLGIMNVQPSEMAKLFVVVYLAAYLVRREDEVRTQWRGFFKPMLVLTIMIALLISEPDFGAVVVLFAACLGMMFLAGMRVSHFAVLGGLAFCLLASMAVLAPYRWERLMTFFDPWSHQFGSGYQLVQSLIAFGRGELFGLGLGASVQKHFYLPEAHTDFVFAIVGEELGFVGASFVVGLFAVMVWRMFCIARHAEITGHKFAGHLAYGIALLFAVQSFINIGVNTGLLPTKGLTLPFFSYGGSSLVVSFLMIACILRIHFETNKP